MGKRSIEILKLLKFYRKNLLNSFLIVFCFWCNVKLFQNTKSTLVCFRPLYIELTNRLFSMFLTVEIPLNLLS